MNEQDKSHLIELISFFYPTTQLEPIATASVSLDKNGISQNGNKTGSFISPPPPQQTKKKMLPNSPRLSSETELNPYFKKIESWFNNNNIIIHISTEAKKLSTPALKPEYAPCIDFESLGNNEIPIFERVRFYLNYIKTIPNSTSFFRPLPNLNPLEITNPQSSVLAMSYDFINVVTAKTDEYCVFLTHLLKCKFDSDPKAHILYWPYWAHYKYPSLPLCYILKSKEDFSSSIEAIQKKEAGFYEFWPLGTNKPLPLTQEATPKLNAKRTRKTEVEAASLSKKSTSPPNKTNEPIINTSQPKRKKKSFLCPNPGCDKVYKNSNGLSYHMGEGRCENTPTKK